MCLNPGRLPDGTEFACRKCWQCSERRIDDWVGRCLAENKTANVGHSITLTYGRDEDGNEDHFRAAWLTYSDVQKFFKLLRRDGYKFRYLVCGEYGSEKGRAHWHLLMFWQGKVPPHELTTSRWNQKRFENKYWPHGFQHWEKPNAKSIRYVCKYIQKDIGKDERQGHISMSKKPPLGDQYFYELALKYVKAGLAPQDLTYRFPEVKDTKGKPKLFFMGGATAQNFIRYYQALWFLHQSAKHHPNSTIIEEHDDRLARGRYDPIPEPRRYPVQAPFSGTGPYLGRCPEDNRATLYSDADGVRWWYRKGKEGYAWLREKETDGGTLTQSDGNTYAIAKRGQDGSQVPPPRLPRNQ
ncbi:hypothetical protein NKI50_28135 [Mesorhizobium sp. M0563]|uniref:rolling circle replication-associated protein n=1 Tax=Mesorhizobium sp. M0563 TaxID=2956959 RepID=UPI0033386779